MRTDIRTSDNRRMFALFERRGFAMEPAENGLVNVEKPLGAEVAVAVPQPL